MFDCPAMHEMQEIQSLYELAAQEMHFETIERTHLAASVSEA